jgi:hypothetical protein
LLKTEKLGASSAMLALSDLKATEPPRWPRSDNVVIYYVNSATLLPILLPALSVAENALRASVFLVTHELIKQTHMHHINHEHRDDIRRQRRVTPSGKMLPLLIQLPVVLYLPSSLECRLKSA